MNTLVSGAPTELLDGIAEAIRDREPGFADTPWADLVEDRKASWRADADRAMAALFTARPDVKALLFGGGERCADAEPVEAINACGENPDAPEFVAARSVIAKAGVV